MPLRERVEFRFRITGFIQRGLFAFYGLLFFWLIRACSSFAQGFRNPALFGMFLVIAIITFLSLRFMFWGWPVVAVFDPEGQQLIVETRWGNNRSFPFTMIKEWKRRTNNSKDQSGVVLYLTNGGYVFLTGLLLDKRIDEVLQELQVPFGGIEKRHVLRLYGSPKHPS